jgi:tetratricopeptide (TPR) repeat protein
MWSSLPEQTQRRSVREMVRWNNRWPILLGSVAIFLLLAWLFPYVASAYYVTAGGRALGRAQSAVPATSAHLERAITHLETALRWQGDNAQAYWLLSQAYLMQKNPTSAVHTLTRYTTQRSGNPQGWWELATIYAQMDSIDEAWVSWLAGGFNIQDAISVLDKAWEAEHYKEVLTWYKLAGALGQDLPTSVTFRSAIAAVIVGHSLPQPLDTANMPVYSLTDHLQVEARDLQWLITHPYRNVYYGDRLRDHPSSAYPDEGVMWWSGAAVAIIDVQTRAEYQITIRALHNAPDAGQLQVEQDFVPLALFPLGRAWQEFGTTAALSPGMHVIGVRYLEDKGDAIVDWIRLQRIAGSNE